MPFFLICEVIKKLAVLSFHCVDERYPTLFVDFAALVLPVTLLAVRMYVYLQLTPFVLRLLLEVSVFTCSISTVEDYWRASEASETLLVVVQWKM